MEDKWSFVLANLDQGSTDNKLRKAFERFGEVLAVKLHENGRNADVWVSPETAYRVIEGIERNSGDLRKDIGAFDISLREAPGAPERVRAFTANVRQASWRAESGGSPWSSEPPRDPAPDEKNIGAGTRSMGYGPHGPDDDWSTVNRGSRQGFGPRGSDEDYGSKAKTGGRGKGITSDDPHGPGGDKND